MVIRSFHVEPPIGPRDTFEGARLKVERAREHIRSVDGWLTEYTRLNPFILVYRL
jgi:hypothetical protein